MDPFYTVDDIIHSLYEILHTSVSLHNRVNSNHQNGGAQLVVRMMKKGEKHKNGYNVRL